MAKRAVAKPIVKNTRLVLSGGMHITLNELPKQAATSLAISLTRSQLLKPSGEVQDDESIDNMTDQERIEMITSSMALVDTILVEDGVLEVELPKESDWLYALLRKNYVRAGVNARDLAMLDNVNIPYERLDKALLGFLYVRFKGIQDDSDFTAILGAAFAGNEEVIEEAKE